MQKSLFGRIFLLDLGFLIPSSQTTGSNLIVKPSGDIVVGIRNWYSTPADPQGNGQAKAVNKVIVNGLKKRLDEVKGRWVEELPHVLWTYQITPRWLTGEIPFLMTYGSKAMILLEFGFPTLRTSLFTPNNND